MHPIFVDIQNELKRVRQEAEFLRLAVERFCSERENLFADPVMHWVGLSAIGSGIEKVYSGIERVMRLLAAEIDGNVPSGETWHQTLLSRMVSELPGVRPATISAATLAKLDELRSFRHRERNSYLIDLKEARVIEIAQSVPEALVSFGADLANFQKTQSI